MAYCAIIRARALTLPFTKSDSGAPRASSYSAAKPSTARWMLKVTARSGRMNCSASCASSSSACTVYGRRTA